MTIFHLVHCLTRNSLQGSCSIMVSLIQVSLILLVLLMIIFHALHLQSRLSLVCLVCHGMKRLK
uniref:Uncharacterized protein n=1 Tax=Rhizophora mucronata TaxID=61149 RepID=A0A2P2NNG9_RHIMU